MEHDWHKSTDPAHAWQLSDVLSEMTHCSISAALVASTLSVSYDPMHANIELSDDLKSHSYLHAVWNVMPHYTGEFPEPHKLEQLMKAHEMRAISVHPKSNAWDWEADHSQVLFRWLEAQEILLIIKRNEFDHFKELNHFLERYPKLSVLLIGAGWAEQRFVLPMIMQYRNLHISFDHFQVHYGLEELCSQGCEDQLIYASHAPLMSMGLRVRAAWHLAVMKNRARFGRTRISFLEIGPAKIIFCPGEMFVEYQFSAQK